MTSQVMSKPLGFRAITLTNFILHTKQKVMASNVMLSASQDLCGCFTSEISLHPETGQGRDILHFMQEFWQCLTSLKQNITTAGLTISIFLHDLQKQQSHKNTIRISGPTCKSGRSLPKCVVQEEKTSPADVRAVWGTVKGVVLEGDSEIPDLVAVSYYDQKPVHFLSTICESIKWIQCEKPVYCVEMDQVEKLKFLCLNINNDYNHEHMIWVE